MTIEIDKKEKKIEFDFFFFPFILTPKLNIY